MTYLEFLARIDSLALIGVDESQLPITIPAIIDAAEQRIYRELDFLATTARDTSLSLVANARDLVYTAKTAFVTLESVHLLLTNFMRATLQPVSRDLLDGVYGSQQPVGQPIWFALVDTSTLLVGPWPDQAYQMELVGTARPAPLYKVPQTSATFLSANLPDLMMAAALAFVSAFTELRPGTAPKGGWEAQYQLLKASAMTEEARRKFEGPGWSSRSLTSAATPNR